MKPRTPQDLAPFLVHARWFGGKGRPFRVTAVHRLGTLGEPTGDHPGVVVDLAEVDYEDEQGGTETYQLPMALYTEPVAALEHARIGAWKEPGLGTVYAYDAVHDRAAMQHWLDAFDATETTEMTGTTGTTAEHAATGALTFHRLPGHDLDVQAHSTLFAGEQSNSSVAFGEDCLMKVFRRMTPGENPDIVMHEVLTRAGSDHVAALYGWLDVRTSEGVLQLAMLQQFLRTASDGWDLAQTSVRNLYAEADLHADEVGGDFAGEASRLGRAVAEVHEVLRESFGTGTVEAAAVAFRMQARCDDALAVVPGLAEHEPTLRAAYTRLAALGEQPVQRIHGDLHLGQTLRTVKGWKIVDFEGEPAKPLADRLLPDSPWRDVAGMLRSFDYAARVVEDTFGSGSPASIEQLHFRAAEWTERNRLAFLHAYAGRELTQSEVTLLTAYAADKAVYEAVYETRNRPSWVSIPLDAIARWGAA